MDIPETQATETQATLRTRHETKKKNKKARPWKI